MKRLSAALVSSLAFATTFVSAQAPPAKPLEIYATDTEGGKAVLFVTPTGQSLLIDSGNPGGRDTDRIMEVVSAAGLKQIDFLLSTHYHVDHIGGMAELAKRIPIGTFVDHGPSAEPKEQLQGFQATYAELYAKAKHLVVKAGDKLPITGVDWRIATAAGQTLKTPLPGGGRANPACAHVPARDPIADEENAYSVGSVVTLGQFRLADFGDLMWHKEQELMCPNNPIGTVDLYIVNHHGLDQSNNPALVHGLQPRVAVMQNGTRKGAGAQAMPTMRRSPGLEDIWQLHWSYTAGIEQNSAGAFIANVDDAATIASVLTTPAPARGGGPGRGAGAPGGGAAPGATPPGGGAPPQAAAPTAGTPAAGQAPAAGAPVGQTTTPAVPAVPPAAATPAVGAATPQGQPGAGAPGAGGGGGRGNAAAAHSPAHWIKVSARPDGSFTVTNSRNGFAKTYAARPRPR